MIGPHSHDPDLIGWSPLERRDFFYNIIIGNTMKEIPLYGWQVGPTPYNGTNYFYYRDREPAHLDKDSASCAEAFFSVKFSCIPHFSQDWFSQRNLCLV